VIELNIQNYEQKSIEIKTRYLDAKREHPERFERRIDYSWSVWMFGVEPFERSLQRLQRNGVRFVELSGDHATKESRLPVLELRKILTDSQVRVSGTCGMYSTENDLSSSSPHSRQNAVDYIRRELAVLQEVGGHYLVVVPSAVGRPQSLDASELIRSTAAIRTCGDDFARANIKAAIEPIRAAEVSLVHSVDQALNYIEVVGHPAIGHVNADTFHMMLGERHIGNAILSCDDRLANLHLADSNRDAPGKGMIDFDTVLMAAYLVGMNEEGRFLTPEPLGPITDPYLLAGQPCHTEIMDELVKDTMTYIREREEYIRCMRR